MAKRLLLILLAAGSLHAASSRDIFRDISGSNMGGPAGIYQFRMSFPTYTAAETLTNFPVLVLINSNNVPGWSTSYMTAAANGYDLQFRDPYGNVMPYEIESYSPTNIWVWVQLNYLNSSNYNSNFTCWMGSPTWSQKSYTTDGSVWAKDVGVYHLATTGGILSVYDSSPTHASATNMSATAINGYVDGSAYISGSGFTYIQLTNLVRSISNCVTVSAWVNLSSAAYYPMVMSAATGAGDGNEGFELRCNSSSGNPQFSVDEQTGRPYAISTVNIVGTGWHHLAGTYDGTRAANNILLYLDGVQAGIGSGTGGIQGLTNSYPVIGDRGTTRGYPWLGSLDEVRIDPVARSSNWVWASYIDTASNRLMSQYSYVGMSVPQTYQPIWLTNDQTVAAAYGVIRGANAGQAINAQITGPSNLFTFADTSGLSTMTHSNLSLYLDGHTVSKGSDTNGIIFNMFNGTANGFLAGNGKLVTDHSMTIHGNISPITVSNASSITLASMSARCLISYYDSGNILITNCGPVNVGSIVTSLGDNVGYAGSIGIFHSGNLTVSNIQNNSTANGGATPSGPIYLVGDGTGIASIGTIKHSCFQAGYPASYPIAISNYTSITISGSGGYSIDDSPYQAASGMSPIYISNIGAGGVNLAGGIYAGDDFNGVGIYPTAFVITNILGNVTCGPIDTHAGAWGSTGWNDSQGVAVSITSPSNVVVGLVSCYYSPTNYSFAPWNAGSLTLTSTNGSVVLGGFDGRNGCVNAGTMGGSGGVCRIYSYGNITITGTTVTGWSATGRYGTLYATSTTGNITINTWTNDSFSVTNWSAISLSAPAGARFTGSLLGFNTNASSGTGMSNAPFVTSQTVLRCPAGQFVYYLSAWNSYLHGAYKLADMSGNAAQGGTLMPSDTYVTVTKLSLLSQPWQDFACSTNGQIVYACCYATTPGITGVVHSVDGGNTWSVDLASKLTGDANGAWYGVSCNALGTKAAVSKYDNSGHVWMTTNTGSAWSSIKGGGAYRNIRMSSDGSTMVLPKDGLYADVTTNNYTSFNTISSYGTYNSVPGAISSNGYCIFYSQGGSSRYLYLDHDYGATVGNTVGSAVINNMEVLTCAQGTTNVLAYACYPSGPVYISTNTGVSWTSLSLTNGPRLVLLISPDARTVLTQTYGVGDSPIDITYDGGATWNQIWIPGGCTYASAYTCTPDLRTIYMQNGNGSVSNYVWKIQIVHP